MSNMAIRNCGNDWYYCDGECGRCLYVASNHLDTPPAEPAAACSDDEDKKQL